MFYRVPRVAVFTKNMQHIRSWLPDGPLPPPFSLKRMPHTAQRLYLALEPTYLHIASRLWHLAAWKDYSTSLFCCIVGLFGSFTRTFISSPIKALLVLLVSRVTSYSLLSKNTLRLDQEENLPISIPCRVTTTPQGN